MNLHCLLIFFLVTLSLAHATSYHELIYTERDKADIMELLETMSQESLMGLLKHRSALNQLGDRIEHVHPLKFLEIILTNPRLKACLLEINSSFFKRSAFMRGLSKALTRKAKLGEIDPYQLDFSKAVKIPSELLDPYFKNRNWKGLIKTLLTTQSSDALQYADKKSPSPK